MIRLLGSYLLNLDPAVVIGSRSRGHICLDFWNSETTTGRELKPVFFID